MTQQDLKDFFKSNTWYRLEFPILWMPVITFAGLIFINYIIAKNSMCESSFTEIAIQIAIYIVMALILNILYSGIPLFYRFAYMKKPMERGKFPTYFLCFIFGVLGKAFLKTLGLTDSSSLPILQMVAIYFILTADQYISFDKS